MIGPASVASLSRETFPPIILASVLGVSPFSVVVLVDSEVSVVPVDPDVSVVPEEPDVSVVLVDSDVSVVPVDPDVFDVSVDTEVFVDPAVPEVSVVLVLGPFAACRAESRESPTLTDESQALSASAIKDISNVFFIGIRLPSTAKINV